MANSTYSMSSRPGQHQSPLTDKLWLARIKENMNGPPQKETFTRTPSESIIVLDYNFAEDEQLVERYRNPWGSIRVGKLMEDIDACAGHVAFRHCSDRDEKSRPPLVVTASVDRMSMLGQMRLDVNARLVGFPTWVGRTSIKIRIQLVQALLPSLPAAGEEEDERVLLVANFTFVARDIKTGKGMAVNRLQPQTAEEVRLFEEGQALDEARRKRMAQAGPGAGVGVAGADERVAKLLAEARVLQEMPALAPRDAILQSSTVAENVMVCQPQQRNLYGRIFGGFLMRRALELAFANSYLFSGSRPVFHEVDHIDFHRPVEVGDLLRFKTCILYTGTHRTSGAPLIHTEVFAYITKPEARSSQVSNSFYFTFTLQNDKDAKEPVKLLRVLPETEEEARRTLMRFDADLEAI